MRRAAAPADVVQAVAAGVSRLVAGQLTDEEKVVQIDRLVSLYAEPTHVRHPLAPLGDEPMRTRAELRRHFADGPARIRGVERFEPVGEVHRTADPEVVVFEFRYEGVFNGQPFSLPSVFVTRVRDGLIIESRDYIDHVGVARAFGRLGSRAGR